MHIAPAVSVTVKLEMFLIVVVGGVGNGFHPFPRSVPVVGEVIATPEACRVVQRCMRPVVQASRRELMPVTGN